MVFDTLHEIPMLISKLNHHLHSNALIQKSSNFPFQLGRLQDFPSMGYFLQHEHQQITLFRQNFEVI